MICQTFIYRTAAVVVGCAVMVSPIERATAADQVPVQAYVQSPFLPIPRPLDNLDSIEGWGSSPIYQNRFGIDYDAAQALIDRLVKQNVPAHQSGTETCTDPCPDVDWEVNLTPTFHFTQRGQPVLRQVGQSGDATIEVSLTTQFRLDVHADVSLSGNILVGHHNVPVDAFVEIVGTSSVQLTLWPTIQATVIKPPEFVIVDKNIDLSLNGTGIDVGARWGGTIGAIGFVLGVPPGPLVGAAIGAIFGDIAAEKAEDVVKQKYATGVSQAVATMQPQAQAKLQEALNTVVSGISSPRDALLGAQVPGLGVTVGNILDKAHTSFDLHTTTPSGGFAVSVVQRFDPAPASGQISGAILFQKQACHYVKISQGTLAGAVISTGYGPWNQDLAAKVGQPCSSVLGQGGLVHRGYLGSNPQDALGPVAQHLDNWRDGVGNFSLPGNLTDGNGFYACAFQLTALPDVGIIDLETIDPLKGRLPDHAFHKRFLEAALGSQRMLIDNRLSPLPAGTEGTQTLVIGGAAPVNCGGSGGNGGIPQSLADKLKDIGNPEKCPNCGAHTLPGRENIVEVNGDALLQTSIGQELRSALGQRPVTQVPQFRVPQLPQLMVR
jgi:hypothetical protein